MTNDHVVEGARSLEVVFANGERRSAEVVGTDADADLAVIQVNELPAGIGPLPLAAADDIAVGQFVVAIGNPFGEQGSMSLGIVSGLGRSLTSQRAEQSSGSSYTLPAVIQTDAPCRIRRVVLLQSAGAFPHGCRACRRGTQTTR